MITGRLETEDDGGLYFLKDPDWPYVKRTKPENELMTELTTAERNIIEALGDDTLNVEQLAPKAGYELSGHFRAAVNSLRKRGILGNNQPGYYVMSEYKWLLQELSS